MEQSEKILIIGCGWEQVPLIAKAKSKGLFVIATTWWDEERLGADKVYRIDSRDISALEKLVECEKPNYIIADECDYSMYAVAYLTEKYGLIGPSLQTQTITNNKYLQRKYVEKGTVLQPKYELCCSVEQAKSVAGEIGYPVMVKPIDNRGSIGVSKVLHEGEMADAWYKGVVNSYSRLCIVEKCIEGRVITADGFCDSNGYEFIAPSNKDMYANNHNLAKVVYYPGVFSDKLYKSIKKNAEEVVELIGINYGFVHIEFIIENGSDDIYLVEVANRGGGVYTSLVVLENITGIDYCDALIDLSMGKEVCVRSNQQYVDKSIIYFLSLEGESVIDGTETLDEFGCDICYINVYRESADTKNEAALGRHGVAVFSGGTFDELVNRGKRLERGYKQGNKDYLIR